MSGIETGKKTEIRLVKIPKQDYKSKKGNLDIRPTLDDELVGQLREVFEMFSKTEFVNPYDIKNGLRLVGKTVFNRLDFHKNHPHIYKLIEDLCLQYDYNQQGVNFKQFISFLDDKLGDNTTRQGLTRAFDLLVDPEVNEITPESLFKQIQELGDEISLEDVKYILEVISEPSKDINITSDEFYYIMTKRPADVDMITPVTKSFK